MQWRRLLRCAAAVYAVAVLWATLGPAPWSTVAYEVPGGILNPAAWTDPGTWSTGYVSEIAFNIALFIPVGILAAGLLPRRRAGLALAVGVAATVAIELVQLPLPDRISDPRDLLANSAGALLGVAVVAGTRLVRDALPLLRRADPQHPVTAPAAAPAAPERAAAATGPTDAAASEAPHPQTAGRRAA